MLADFSSERRWLLLFILARCVLVARLRELGATGSRRHVGGREQGRLGVCGGRRRVRCRCIRGRSLS